MSSTLTGCLLLVAATMTVVGFKALTDRLKRRGKGMLMGKKAANYFVLGYLMEIISEIGVGSLGDFATAIPSPGDMKRVPGAFSYTAVK